MKPRSAIGDKHKLIFIVGPTATGKSEIAFKLAKKLKTEIISCDSMQVYRCMDTLSQSPPQPWQKSIPHHLIGVLNPRREYSVAQFRKNAFKYIKRITRKKKIPVIVGGSGLYMKALIDGLFPSPKKDIKLREHLKKESEKKGPNHLYSKLKEIDPQTASTIHPNDLRRIIRALEVYYLTGQALSMHKKKTKGITSDFDIYIFGLNMARNSLYEKINQRTDHMFRRDLINEVKKLSKKKLSITARASLGYKEIQGYLTRQYDLDEAKELLKKNTRRFAKRQLTWFRAEKRIRWIDLDKFTPLEVVKIIKHEIDNTKPITRN